MSNSNKERLLLAVDALTNETLRKEGDDWSASPEFVFSLSEAVNYFATQILKPDILAFAAHAKRKTVIVEDVKLIARRHPMIADKIGFKFNDERKDSMGTKKQKKRKKVLLEEEEEEEENEDSEEDKGKDFEDNASVSLPENALEEEEEEELFADY